MKYPYMDQVFVLKAKQVEKRFRKRIQSGEHSYRTGMGCVLGVKEFTAQHIIFKVNSTQCVHRITRGRFRQALTYALFYRNVSRKALERFDPFTSHLMALLNAALSDLSSRIITLANRKLCLVIKGVRYFFSGLEASPKDRELISKLGAKFVLLSNFYLREYSEERIYNILNHCRDLGLHIIIDSGTFSVMKAQRRNKDVDPICLKQYSTLIQKIKPLIIGYFNLDVENLKQTEENLEYLSQSVKMPPYPVWHESYGWDTLERWVNSSIHLTIAIGGTVFMSSQNQKRKFFQKIFSQYSDRQTFHWLGGSNGLLHEFPFLSTDSTGYNVGRRFRRLLPLNSSQKMAAASMTSMECLKYNIRQMVKLEDSHVPLQTEFMI
ncbi:hypothetical protein [Paenibacillus glucanolyticus]|uniref:hypothetical protein n=1 Tax=Paenibacillus glucanolyticus TaxID=59843 RepID=UPI00096BF891|nr:hypothetical protein [Paenibacillus glucanolyticus]OMF66841.1 hypothetical protein BK142_29040 [Paenibacillus glucanolyticus]